MQCLKCGHVAEDGKRFCPKCGESLAEAARIEAEKLEQARLLLEEERKAALLDQEQPAEIRPPQRELWRQRLWDDRRGRLLSILVLIALTIGPILGGVYHARQLRNRAEATRSFIAAIDALTFPTSSATWDQLVKLVQIGADVNAPNTEGTMKGFSLLSVAILTNDSTPQALNLINLMLDRSANVYARNVDGSTPLDIAASRSAAIISMMLAHGAAVNETLIFSAADGTDPQAIDVLIQHHAA